MKTFQLFLFLLTLAFLNSCSSTEPRTENSKFEFEHEGETYEIVGLVSADGGSTNDLVLRKDRELVFWARDFNQDGIINQVVSGDISLEKANEIYEAGIRIAEEQGKYEKKQHPRTYHYGDEDYLYSVITVLGRINSNYNVFIIFNIKSDVEIKLTDSNMDGTLDDGSVESEVLRQWQQTYKKILEQGVKERKIDLTEEGKYRVRVNR